MFFKTKKKVFGLFPVENVNTSILVEGIKYFSELDMIRESFKKEKPWFPVDDIIDVSGTPKWFFGSDKLDQSMLNTKPEGKPTEIEEERDTEKYFF